VNGWTHLNPSNGHAELVSENLAQTGVGFCIAAEMVFEDLELGAGCPLPVFDLVGGVGIECAEVDGGRVGGR
jgi:hypothetical protein